MVRILVLSEWNEDERAVKQNFNKPASVFVSSRMTFAMPCNFNEPNICLQHGSFALLQRTWLFSRGARAKYSSFCKRFVSFGRTSGFIFHFLGRIWIHDSEMPRHSWTLPMHSTFFENCWRFSNWTPEVFLARYIDAFAKTNTGRKPASIVKKHESLVLQQICLPFFLSWRNLWLRSFRIYFVLSSLVLVSSASVSKQMNYCVYVWLAISKSKCARGSLLHKVQAGRLLRFI